jgi:A/G-specific adenine glycosylase
LDKNNRRAKKGVNSALLSWFDGNGRSFPWRDTFEKPDPYVILFTEIMLQRTRAEQVKPVYLEFVTKYPTFYELSLAPRSDVVSLFSRLGLKWRAKNVPRLIRQIKKLYHGTIPREIDALRKLPAVGEYVAAAVACYAFGQRTVAVDSNVVRVISRLFGIVVTLDSGRRDVRLVRMATSLAPQNRIRDFNLALLDISAMICKPKPLCDICPLVKYCAFYSKSQTNRSLREAVKPSSTLIQSY